MILKRLCRNNLNKSLLSRLTTVTENPCPNLSKKVHFVTSFLSVELTYNSHFVVVNKKRHPVKSAFNLPENNTDPGLCQDGSIWVNLSTDKLRVCFDEVKHDIFYGGMDEIGPTTDPDLIEWALNSLSINGDINTLNNALGIARNDCNNLSPRSISSLDHMSIH